MAKRTLVAAAPSTLTATRLLTPSLTAAAPITGPGRPPASVWITIQPAPTLTTRSTVTTPPLIC